MLCYILIKVQNLTIYLITIIEQASVYQNIIIMETKISPKIEADETLSHKREMELMNSLCIESQETLQKRLKKLKLQEEEFMRRKLKENKEIGVEGKPSVIQSDFVTVVSDITHVHPGLQVFEPLHFGSYYNTEFLLTENILMISPAYLQRLIIKEAVVLYYILHTFKLLKPQEIVVIFRILIISALDSNFHEYVFNFKRALGALLDAVSESVWVNIVNELITSVKLNTLGIQNTLFVCTNLLPESQRGHQISLHLSRRLLQRLLNVKFNGTDNSEVTVRSLLNMMHSAVDIHEEPHQKLYQIMTLADSMVARIGNKINVDDLKELCTTCSNLKSQLDHSWMNKLDINYSLLRELIARTVSLWGMQITSVLENRLHLGPQFTSF